MDNYNNDNHRQLCEKVVLEQPEEQRTITIGIDGNQPWFSIGHQKFKLDASVIENREHAEWYRSQLMKAFDNLAFAAPNAQGAAVPDAYNVIHTMAQEFKEGWPEHTGKYDWMIGYAERLKRAPSHQLTTKE